jgi:PAS domain S-box-containing protein
MDVAGRIIRANRAAGALLQRELATLIGKFFGHICPTADVPTTPWRLLERASNGVLTDIEVELRSQSGRVVPVSMSCVLVRDRQGKVTGVLAMARDITARLQAEAAQRELQKQLVQASRRAGWRMWPQAFSTTSATSSTASISQRDWSLVPCASLSSAT